MSSFEREFNSAVEAVEREVFINLVCENPQLTLAELTKLGKGKFANLLDSVRVGDIIDAGTQGVAVNGRGYNDDERVGSDGSGRIKAKSVNTRTPEGRNAYDEAVFAIVDGADRPIKLPEITSAVGGTALQVRKSLARLIEQGKVTWDGKARGMCYSSV